jgi:LPXTG-motif cell wall-anchored protein
MLKTNLIVTSVLAVVLLSGAFFSLATAQEDIATPDSTVVPDQTRADAPDNATVTQDGDQILYTMDDNSTAPQRDSAPDVADAENADATLTSTQTGTDNTMLIAAGAIVLSVVVCAVGVFGYRRKIAKA